ncbi:hypothetical protein NEMBOFW57_006381 [Staphylotrichum longicolle]|uniref:Agroclavine dehydrogenase n=1 Tax=Staphylotrichum longicolle TaxID=669026 RepID=A0AAD4F1Y7_9PEZI|nr:hypothetical protein NEMBOFW57_006381 [Staphylotrichum longicolle]
MPILLTGGSGAKTARRIASLCSDAGIPYLFASRRGGSDAEGPAVRFDWTDQTTYAAPFAHAFPGGDTIHAVYLVMPRVPEPDKPINAFIDYAAERGVKRFVLMAGTSAKMGTPGPGKVWEYMVQKGVEWAVCRPTWFMENLSDGFHLKTVREDAKIYSCVGDGKVPFVSAFDIGGVAFAALTQPEPPNTDYRIMGPKAITHDEVLPVAATLSKVLARPIQHVSLSPEDRLKQMTEELKLPAQYSGFMVALEKLGAAGSEEYMDDTVERMTGRKPLSFETFVEQNKHLWVPA